MSGYRHDTTPNLQRIANLPAGNNVSYCFSHAMYTLPSSTSILTGTVPSYHGVNGHVNETVPQSIDTVPELLDEFGYNTGCLSQIPRISDATGLSRGFNEYEFLAGWRNVIRSEPYRDVAHAACDHFVNNLLRALPDVSSDLLKLYTGFPLLLLRERTERLLRRFESANRPYFMYLHTREPHYPYRPPLSYLDRYLDGTGLTPDEAFDLSLDVYGDISSIKRTIAEGCPFSDDEWAAIEALYDASIRFADSVVGDIFETIRAESSRETVVVVTADHGDLFGEQDLIAHQLSLHDGLTHVPLVTHGFDAIADLNESSIVQHTDIVATLLASLGSRSDQLQGIDLRSSERTHAFSEMHASDATLDELRSIAPEFDASRFHRSPTIAVRNRNLKYEQSDNRSVLFDLPDETTDISEQRPDASETFEEAIREYEQRFPANQTSETGVSYSESMKAQMRALGYRADPDDGPA